MKTIRLLLIFSLFLSANIIAFAQQETKRQLLLIHEDNVIVGKNADYLKAGKGLAELITSGNIENLTFSAFRLDDYTYWYVSPIQNMAQLDTPPWKALSEKVGKEKFETTMAAFDGTYDSHRDFVAVFHPELSYKPEQLQEEGNDYKRWMYFYFNQDNYDKVMATVREWKKLYEDNNIPSGYTVYTNGFGHEGPVLVIHSWAKSPADYAAITDKRHEVLGSRGQELWERSESLAYRIEHKSGWFMPELSNMPQDPGITQE